MRLFSSITVALRSLKNQHDADHELDSSIPIKITSSICYYENKVVADGGLKATGSEYITKKVSTKD